MNIELPQNWPKTIEQATTIQQQLSSQVIKTDKLNAVQFVAGVDVGFEQNDTISQAAVAVLSYPDLKLQEYAISRCQTTFPYVPGFLSFREVPVVLEALKKLTITPDIILCDGQGMAHPKRFGLACHLGVLTNIPTIGVAKSRYIGTHEELPIQKGSWKPLIDQGEMIGAILRSRTNVKPIYVSIGHKISLETAIDYVLHCLTQYRLPETTRLADRIASNRGSIP